VKTFSVISMTGIGPHGSGIREFFRYPVVGRNGDLPSGGANFQDKLVGMTAAACRKPRTGRLKNILKILLDTKFEHALYYENDFTSVAQNAWHSSVTGRQGAGPRIRMRTHGSHGWDRHRYSGALLDCQRIVVKGIFKGEMK
jgi:hypothetical protein